MNPVTAPVLPPQPPVTPPARPGKSANSVGHLAKAAVAAARDAGAALPKNAQGVAASAIARGAAPESVFAAQIAALTPEPVDETPLPPAPETLETPQDTPDQAETLPATAEAIAGYTASALFLSATSQDSAETALELLKSP